MLVPHLSYAQFNTYSQAGPPGSDQAKKSNNNDENGENYVKRKPSYIL